MLLISKPDRGAKRPRGEEKGGSVGDDELRGVKHQKGQSARHREAATLGPEVGGEIRENEEINGEKKMILEKLLDQDEEEPEVGEKKKKKLLPKLLVYSKQVIHLLYVLSYRVFLMVQFSYVTF